MTDTNSRRSLAVLISTQLCLNEALDYVDEDLVGGGGYTKVATPQQKLDNGLL